VSELPASIRVGYRDFAIKAWSARDAEAAGDDGYCDKLNGIIGIREDLDAIEKLVTLCHELKHAAWKVGCLPQSADEEAAVSVLSNIDVQIWRDNPDFLAFLTASLA
jgi:hypothetical protein